LASGQAGLLFRGHERLRWRGLEQEEKTMKLISSYELQKRSESELSALFCTVSKGLVRTKRGSPERRNSLASLENISRARTARMQKCAP
jgi:hypothetical protein